MLLCLHSPRPSGAGWDYQYEVLGSQQLLDLCIVNDGIGIPLPDEPIWLCPVLLDYFDAPPLKFHVLLEPHCQPEAVNHQLLMPFDLSSGGDCRPLMRVKRMRPNAILPSYATDGSGCFDFHATGSHLLAPGCQQSVPLGWAVEVPPDSVLLLFGRSGLAAKHGVSLANSVGVIDSDFRGELVAMLTMPFGPSRRDLMINAGDRVAQGLIIRAPQYGLAEVDELSDTARGTGGFGSTGA